MKTNTADTTSIIACSQCGHVTFLYACDAERRCPKCQREQPKKKRGQK